VVLPSLERPYVFESVSPTRQPLPSTSPSSKHTLDTWDIFRRSGQHVRVVEHEALQVYCGVLVRKSRIQQQAKKGRAKNFLRWEADEESGLDLTTQVTYEYFVQNEDDLLAFLSVLTVYAVDRASHGAQLRCAAGAAGSDFDIQMTDVLVSVDYPPTFTIRRTPGFGIPVTQGMTVSLACDADVRPKMTGRWLKDEQLMNSTNDGVIIVDRVSVDDIGWYQVR